MRHQVLDHGYVELVESWGSDERIIEAARMSTGKGFLGWGPKHADDCRYNRPGESKHVHHEACCDGVPGDEKLLAFLWKNAHATPFEMGGLVLEVQAPIFVFREWHRHRTQSYNELSARYTPLPDLNYVPTVERLMMNAGTSNRQAGTTVDARELTPLVAGNFRQKLMKLYAAAQDEYEWALSAGVPKELARIHLPVGRYSRMRASANLRNWLAFLTLRMAANAQWEIRQYAHVVASIVEECFPRTYGLFAEGR